MSKKYTPGPWRFVGQGILINAHKQEIVLADLFDEPNALLIACAPELLEALERTLFLYEHALTLGQLRQIKQLIAKATGARQI